MGLVKNTIRAGREFARLICLSCICYVGLSACATSGAPLDNQRLKPEVALQDMRVISVPFEQGRNGLLYVEMDINGERTAPFIVDTGATRTAIYKDLAKQVTSLPSEQEDEIHVYGLDGVGRHNIITLPHLKLAELLVEKTDVIILETPPHNINGLAAEGILGLDILSNYRLLLDSKMKMLHLIPHQISPLDLSEWFYVPLSENPYRDGYENLRFTEMRIAGKVTPALIDTGSEFTFINWKAADFSQVRRLRQRLKESWVIQGSVGEFRPTSRVRISSLRAGQKFWSNEDFIITDFESLDVLGANTEPFLVVGMNLLGDRDIYIDFANKELRIKPGQDDLERAANYGKVFTTSGTAATPQ